MTRKPPLKRRTRLKSVSPSKQDWNLLYREAHERDESFQHCANCGLREHKHFLDRHHPHARNGKWILEYVYLCGRYLQSQARGCGKHVEIHDKAKKARAEGWLTEVYDGKPFDPEKVRPWKYLPDKKGEA